MIQETPSAPTDSLPQSEQSRSEDRGPRCRPGRSTQAASEMGVDYQELLPPPPQHPEPREERSSRSRGRQPYRLGSVEEVPELRRRPFIAQYYRMGLPCLKDLCACHNETGNIWSHAVAFVLTLVQFARWLQTLQAGPSLNAVQTAYCIGIGGFFVMGLVVFSVSVQYHWRMCSTDEDFLRWMYADQAACLAMVIACFFAGVPMGFHCFPFLQAFYTSLCLIVSCLMGVTVALTPREKWDVIASVIIGGTSLMYIVPAVHWLVVCDVGRDAIGAKFGVQMVISVIAALLFTYYIPERFAPGKFDRIGNSHQLWHVAVYIVYALFGECVTQVNGLIIDGTFCQ